MAATLTSTGSSGSRRRNSTANAGRRRCFASSSSSTTRRCSRRSGSSRPWGATGRGSRSPGSVSSLDFRSPAVRGREAQGQVMPVRLADDRRRLRVVDPARGDGRPGRDPDADGARFRRALVQRWLRTAHHRCSARGRRPRVVARGRVARAGRWSRGLLARRPSDAERVVRPRSSVGRAFASAPERGQPAHRGRSRDPPRARRNGCVLLGDHRYYRRFGLIVTPAFAPPQYPPEHFQIVRFGDAYPTSPVAFHPGILGWRWAADGADRLSRRAGALMYLLRPGVKDDPRGVGPFRTECSSHRGRAHPGPRVPRTLPFLRISPDVDSSTNGLHRPSRVR